MNETFHNTVKKLIREYGNELLEDPRRFSALLMDSCPEREHRPAINLVRVSLQENIPQKLSSVNPNLPTKLISSRLEKELQENHSLQESAAHWIVSLWINVLAIAEYAPQPLPQSIPKEIDKESPILKREEEELIRMFNEGCYAYDSGNWRAARELLEEVLRRRPGFTYQGRSAANLLVDAEQHLKSGMRKRPNVILFAGLAIAIIMIVGIGSLSGFVFAALSNKSSPAVFPPVTTSLIPVNATKPIKLTLTTTPTIPTASTSTPTTKPTPTLANTNTPTATETRIPTQCAITIGTRFVSTWNEYSDELGCPTNQAHSHEAASQGFERGALLWRIEPDQVYVMYSNGSLEFYPLSVYPASVRENPPGADPNITPPSGLQQPVRGFGLIWRDNPSVREGIGWAIEGENRADWFYGFEAQDFVGGTIIHECRMGIRILFSEGTWIQVSKGSPCN